MEEAAASSGLGDGVRAEAGEGQGGAWPSRGGSLEEEPLGSNWENEEQLARHGGQGAGVVGGGNSLYKG